MTKFGGFLQRKNIRPSAKLYFIDTMSSMALGLFASLLIGTIFRTLGQYTGVALFTEIAGFASKATGAALGVAIAYALKAPPLVLLSAAVVGMIGNDLGTEIAREGAWSPSSWARWFPRKRTLIFWSRRWLPFFPARCLPS